MMNDEQNAGNGDQAWVLLKEISLPDFLGSIDTGNEWKRDLLDNLEGELNIPPECLLKLEKVLSAFPRDAAMGFRQEKLATPVSFRLFCQKKMIEKRMRGGWSYFLIEKTNVCSNRDSGNPQHLVDLYIYREGD